MRKRKLWKDLSQEAKKSSSVSSLKYLEKLKRNEPERFFKQRNEANWRQKKIKATDGNFFSIDNYYELLNAQKGICAICYKKETRKGVNRLSVDHDHKTGIVRGLLCHNCNTLLGKVDDVKQLLLNAYHYLGKN